MSARWEADHCPFRHHIWKGGDLDILDETEGLCSGRMICHLGNADNSYSYKSLADFKHDLKVLKKYCNHAGAKFYFCFTNEGQDKERSYLDQLGFDTKEISDTGLYFSSITKLDFAKNFSAPKRRRFK